MRVFRDYSAVLHRSILPFKDTFGFIEKFLAEAGLTYRENYFYLEIWRDDIDAFRKKYPEWEPYYARAKKFPNERNQITNARRLWDENAPAPPPAERDELKKLVSKIPRPLNPMETSVVFEGINWFGAEPAPAHIKVPHEKDYISFTSNLISNSIQFSRAIWPSGADTFVHFRVELTDPADELGVLDDGAIFDALNAHFFNKAVRQNTFCVFSEAEQKRIDAAETKAAALFAEIQTVTYAAAADLTDVTVVLAAAQTSFSVKKPLQKEFASLGYRYHYLGPGMFEARKITEHGFQITVGVYYKIGFPTVELIIDIAGVNFSGELFRKQTVHTSQEVVNQLIIEGKNAAEYAEKVLEGPLFELFGATPEWYFEYSR